MSNKSRCAGLQPAAHNSCNKGSIKTSAPIWAAAAGLALLAAAVLQSCGVLRFVVYYGVLWCADYWACSVCCVLALVPTGTHPPHPTPQPKHTQPDTTSCLLPGAHTVAGVHNGYVLTQPPCPQANPDSCRLPPPNHLLVLPPDPPCLSVDCAMVWVMHVRVLDPPHPTPVSDRNILCCAHTRPPCLCPGHTPTHHACTCVLHTHPHPPCTCVSCPHTPTPSRWRA